MLTSATFAVDRSAMDPPLSALTFDGLNGDLVILRDGFAMPARLWRRIRADSPFLDGEVQVGAVLSQTGWAWRVQQWADSAAALDTAVAAVEAALSQFRFPMVATIDGVASTWTCDCADITPGGEVMYDTVRVRYVWEAAVTIPCHPRPS